MPKVKQMNKQRNKRMNIQQTIYICRFDENARIPVRKHVDDAGYDIESIDEIIIATGDIQAVSTGLGFTPPSGYYGQIFSRSGLALKGLVVEGGVIDRGYRGE